jgi:probable HAF family extracellular repeat protein
MRFALENNVSADNSRRLSHRFLPVVMLLLGSVSEAVAQPAFGQATGGRDSPHTTYRVINLGPGTIAAYPNINASGQVAYSLVMGGRTSGFFYDGKGVRHIGWPGGGTVRVAGLNDAGQVTGTALNGRGVESAFVWSVGGGMLDLVAQPGGGRSYGMAINNRGVVTGAFSRSADGTDRPFRWTLASGLEDLGPVSGLPAPSAGRALNDAGLIAGVSTIDDETTRVFAWTRARGMVDIDTLGSVESTPVAVGAQGEVAGNRLASPEDGGDRPFLWTSAGGMVDLGIAHGSTAWVSAMTPGLHIAGGIGFPDGRHRAMSWTRRTGMRELGTLGGRSSVARAVNGAGQIVGYAEDRAGAMRAFVWRADSGMLDLNRFLRHAPPGLVLDHALAISHGGAIVASSNAGLVLLRPDHGRGSGHVLGPIVAPRTVRVRVPVQAGVRFVDGDRTGTRSVAWSWGDGSGGPARTINERGGTGSASASHSFNAPGTYTVTVTLVDREGCSAAVSHDVVVTTGASVAAGPAG